MDWSEKTAIAGLKKLPEDLLRKSQRLLNAYGGLDGISSKPPWLVNAVLKSWFSESERIQILAFVFKHVTPEKRTLMLTELGLK